MKQVENQWIAVKEEEELQDATALEGRQTLQVQHKKDSIICTTALIPSDTSFSSSSPPPPTSNGHSNGFCSVSVEEPLIQKEEEEGKEPHTQKEDGVEEINGNVVENGTHLNDEVGLVAESVGDATNGEAIDCTATTTINGAASQNKNSVYFDQQQGMWKCHHCSWSKRIDISWNVPFGNLKEYDDLLMKTMIQHGPCYFCEIKGNEVNGLKGVQHGDGSRSDLPKTQGEGEFEIQVEKSDIQNSLCNEVNQCDKVPSSSELSPLHNSSEIQATTAEKFGGESSGKAFPNLVKEIDQQLEELDVEAVLAKQETHDLFCPKCKSCITKRVILKKRKRNIHNLDTETKPNKSHTKRVNSSAHEANQGGHAIATPGVDSLEPTVDNYEPEREPEVFRCLSCFSFFIPLRNGIKLFPNFGGAQEPETSQNPLIIPAPNLENPSNVASSNSNWFISVFTKKGKKAGEQGDASAENSSASPAEHHYSSSTTTNVLTSPENDNSEGPFTDTAISKNVGDASVKNSRAGPAEEHYSSSSTTNMLTSPENDDTEGLLADTAISKNVPGDKPERGGVNSPIPSSVKSVTIEPLIENGMKSSMASGNEPLADQKCPNSSNQNDLSSIQPCTQNSSNVMNGSQKVRMDFIDFSAKEHLLTDVGEKKNDSVDMIKTDTIADISSMSSSSTTATTEIHFNAGRPEKVTIMKSYEGSLILKESQKDVSKTPEIAQNSYSSLMQEAQSTVQSFGSAVVTNDIEAFKSSASQTGDEVPVQGTIVTEPHTQIYIGEQPRAETGEPPKWEILKSIVYGGLTESITSLGIVSSAAGSGAAPLNIIALGFANLIGGLFLIVHNLIELKNDHSGGDLQQMNTQEDRYQEQLGTRANFLLHAVVVVLSFLIFGSIPILVYGLLIHKNYDAEVKLATVAATSVVCIILLAIGKVYTKRPPKSYTTTMLHYVTLALAASGVSYIAGGLLSHLLQKFSGSNLESGFVLNLPFSGTRSVERTWMSY